VAAVDGWIFERTGLMGLEVTTTLRTSLPVRGSARTTCVLWVTFWAGAGIAGVTSAARLGEAASMPRAIKKQIYTFLFDNTI
jgi:hypothetical protein